MLHSTLYIMWPMHIATSNSLRGGAFTRKYILWPWPWSHMKRCPVPSTLCDLCTCKVWSCYIQRFRRRYIYKKIHYLTFGHDLGVEVSWNIAQYPLHYVTYATAKFEVAMSNSLWGDAFSRKYIIWSCPWSQGHTKHCPVPSTLCYLCTCKVWSGYVQQFWRRCNCKKHDIRTHRQTDRWRTDFGTKLKKPFFLKKKGV